MQHLQYNCGQIGAHYFRVGKGRTIIKVFFAVQPIANAIAHSTTAPGPLVGASLGYWLYGQALDLGTKTIAGQPCAPGVNDIAYAWHGQ